MLRDWEWMRGIENFANRGFTRWGGCDIMDEI